METNVLRGSTYRQGNPGAALVTLIAPAANTKGVVLYAVSIFHFNLCRLMSKNSAPAAWTDSAARTIVYGLTNSTYYSQPLTTKLTLPLIILPGEGIYFQSDGGVGAADNLVDITAEVLA